MIDAGHLFWKLSGAVWGQNTIKNRVENVVFFWDDKIFPVAACGDPRAALGYLEATGMPGGCSRKPDVNGLKHPPGSSNNQKPKNWWLWALGL